jgi:hypothetical protein
MYDYEPVMTPASKPLTLESYTTYVLIPYITAWLIGEDIGTDVDGGWEGMQRGNGREIIDALNASDIDLNAVNDEDHKAIAITQKGKKGKENKKATVCYSLFIVTHCGHSNCVGSGLIFSQERKHFRHQEDEISSYTKCKQHRQYGRLPRGECRLHSFMQNFLTSCHNSLL